jgi:elongation factor Ts
VTEISAAMVKQLRDATSAGMMDCKRALIETDGDFDAAVKHLREQGMASAAKRAGRETSEGIVLTRLEGSEAAIAAVGCETEPVSKNDEFRAFAAAVLDAVYEQGELESEGELEKRRVELGARLGENVQLVGARRMQAAEGQTLAEYVHPPAHKIGVLLLVRGGSPELARQLAMHISFARPTYAHREEVPAELVASEREILGRLPELESKPTDVREKIVEGMLNKRFYAESVLGEQAWIHDTGLTVARALAQGGLELIDYAWYSVG